MVTRPTGEEGAGLNRRGDVRCAVCGSRDVMAEIEGKFYCFKCGSKIVRENVLRQIEAWRRAGLIPEVEESEG